MRRAIIVVTALSFWFPAAASAQHHHRHSLPDPVAYMRVIAARYWGTQPCGGNYVVTTGDPRSVGGTDFTLGWASWNGPSGRNVESDPPSLFTDCVMTFNRVDPAGNGAASWTTFYINWPSFCQEFLHEAGHLTGHYHSTDPRSVMYPLALDGNMPNVCLTRPDGVRHLS